MSEEHVSDSPQPESPQSAAAEDAPPTPPQNSQEDEILSHFQEVTGGDLVEFPVQRFGDDSSLLILRFR